MLATTREKFVRIGVFLLLVIVMCILEVLLISQIPLSGHAVRNLTRGLILGAVAVAYFGAYRPGWVFKSLVDSSQGGP